MTTVKTRKAVGSWGWDGGGFESHSGDPAWTSVLDSCHLEALSAFLRRGQQLHFTLDSINRVADSS